MNYANVHIPGHKDPVEYSYTERRAELFQMIVEAGHPDLVNQSRLAEYYGVDQSTISRDMSHIRDEVEEELADDAKFMTRVVYKKAIRETVEQAKDDDSNVSWMEATELIDRWNEFLFEVEGGLDSAASKHALDHHADFDLEVDDGHVTSDLPDGAQENIDALHDEVRRATSDTRIDEHGDDVDDAAVGLSDDAGEVADVEPGPE